VSPGVRRIFAMALLVVLLARPASAFLSIPDPVEAGLLAKISALLATIQRFEMLALEKWHHQIDIRLSAYAFPEALFREVNVIISTVTDMRSELQQLACVWPTTLRTSILEDLLNQRLVLCRDDYHHTWGSHEGLWDAELQEMHDYVGTMTANMISERTEKTNAEWVQALRDLYAETAQGYLSPGEANRHEAAALAWTNEIALGNGQILAQNLLLRQMARDLDRFDQKKADDMAYYLYRGVTTLAGQEWRGVPPDPSRIEGEP
jgi:hypothetical protein